jgi:ferrochelatase
MRTTAILLVQLGTPEAPTARALRPYLRQFLSDPRVIDLPRWKWSIILELFVLPFRPAQSAAKYARIWSASTGSPLLHYTRRQTELLGQVLPAGVPVAFGMQVGQPSVESVVHDLIAHGVEQLVVLPMYPQYSATTTASAMDVLFKALMKERRIPAVRVVSPYYDHPAYLDALEAIVRQELAGLDWQPEHFVVSFHGIPIRYAQAGDPYATQVNRTTRLLVKRLDWPRDRWTQSYQSLFGREEWLKPYTEPTLQKLARRGVKQVFVVLPGFTADCLETLDEIGHEARLAFQRAGGHNLHACPCLNDHPAWIEAMRRIVLEQGQGWIN